MADILSFDGVEANALTVPQIRAIINRINLNIYNILAGKWDAVDYAEFGQAGHRMEPSKLLEQLRKLLAYYEQLIREIPCEIHTQWDDPSV